MIARRSSIQDTYTVTIPLLVALLVSVSPALAQAPTPPPTATAPAAPAPTAPAPTAPMAAPAAPPADAAAPSAMPAEPAPAPEPAASPAPAETSMAVEAAAPADPVPEVASPDEPPAEEEATTPSLHVGAGLRTGLALTFDDPAADGPSLALADGVMLPNPNEVNVRLLTGGQLTDRVGFTFNLETNQSSVKVLDAIAQVKIADEFQIWIGQHIPAMERNNFNGPFYNNGWNLPVTVHTLPFDIAGRDRGATLWGLVGGGILKYHLSVVDLDTSAGSSVADPNGNDTIDVEGSGIGNARIAARATINLLDPENYYYTSGTYYGAQDTLALGVVYQYQAGVDAIDGSDLDNDLSAFTADLLFEKNLDSSGTITFNGGYWNFEGCGDNYGLTQGNVETVSLFGASSAYLVGLSWLTANKVGSGKLQPNVTLQIGDYDPSVMVLDVGLGYIVNDFNHRWNINYRHVEVDDDAIDPIDMLQVGTQVQL